MTKQKWFNLHSWLGIKLAILLCFILITGTLAVISHEIDWLTNPAKRVLPLPQTTDIHWSLVYQQAKSQSPGDMVASIFAPTDPWFAVEVIRVNKNNQRYRQYFHPITGQYQGDGRWYNWQRFFRMAHRHLMMPTQLGISIVCIMGLVIMGSLVTGTVIYRQWWRGFFRKPRTKNKRVFWNDIHRLLGLWSLWLLILVALTSLWYLIENWGGRAQYPNIGKANSVLAQKAIIQPTPKVISQAINTTYEQHPNMRIKHIKLPSKKGQAITIEGQSNTLLVRDRANNAIFDPLTADLLSTRFAQNLSVHVRISEAADPLHFGYFAGIYSKLVYFIFGIVLSSLAITGTYLYGLHYTRTKTITSKRIAYSIWQGMTKWKWLSIILLINCTILAIQTFF